jgi:hypothetical protein
MNFNKIDENEFDNIVTFCFVDEVGLQISDPSQPYMAIGMLKVKDIAKFNTDLYKFHYSYSAFNLTERKKLINSLVDNPKSLKRHELNNLFLNNRHHEFKYDCIGFPNLEKYTQLIDLILGFDFEFHCIIVDKIQPDFDIEKYGTYWHAYSKFLSLLIKYCCEEEKVVPIVDFLHKPNHEEEIVSILCRLPNVINAIQADSKSFPLLQITDLLMGAIIFEKKKSVGLFPDLSNKVRARNEFENYLKSKFNISCLHDGSGSKNSLKKFNIWNFKPKKTRDNTHPARPSH